MARLEISTFGPFRATRDGYPITRFEADAARALLVYLALHAEAPIPRDALAELLWPERPAATSLHNLRQALNRLRNAIRDREADPPYLLVTHTSLQFNRDSDCWLDVEEFTRLIAAARQHPHRRLLTCPSCMEGLQRSANLYHGDFLADLSVDSISFQEWQVVERERLHREALEVLYHLADYHEAREEYGQAQHYARRQIELEPWREEAHRQLLRALALDGQRSAALVQYETCRRTLAEELGAEPSVETKVLAGQIKAQSHPGTAITLQHLPLAPSAPCRRIPVPTTPLIGRKEELARIADLLRDPAYRLISIVGLGGVGRTRLALAAAAETQGHFADGMCYIPLAEAGGLPPFQPEKGTGLATSMALSTGLSLSRASSPGEQVLDSLRRKEALLLLDDLDAFAPDVDLIVRLLREAPGITFLVTALKPLGIQAEYASRLPGLPVPPDDTTALTPADALETYAAVALFVERAQRTPRGFTLDPENLQDVLRICRLTAGLPLAIELAAAWVERMTPAEIARAAQEDLDFLSTSKQDIPERQRSLRAVFAYAWQFLSPAEQENLVSLAVFRGGFDERAAHTIVGITTAELTVLAERSLITYHPASKRYTWHPLLRQFAADILRQLKGPQSQQGLEEKHSRYFLEMLAQLAPALQGKQPHHAAERTQQEWDNILPAWQQAAARGDHGSLAGGLEGLIRFVTLKGAYEQGVDMLGQAIFGVKAGSMRIQPGTETPADPTHHHVLCRLLAAQAHLLILQGRYGQALLMAQAAIDLAHASRMPKLEAAGHLQMGRVLHQQGDHESARLHLEQALAQAGDDPQLLARITSHLGNIAAARNESAVALDHFQQALRLYQQLDDTLRQADMLNNLGYQLLDSGRYAEAQFHLEQALRLFREIDSRPGQSMASHSLGAIADALGDFPKARAYYDQALRLSLDSGERGGELETLISLSLLFHHIDDNYHAWHIGRRAVELARILDSRVAESMAQDNLGHALMGLGLPAEAAKAYERALALQRETGQANLAAESLAGLARVALAQDDLARAQACAEEILPVLESSALEGASEPLRVFLTCYHVLDAARDPRTQQLLATAHALLQERASRIVDRDLWRSFLENIPAHRELMALAGLATAENHPHHARRPGGAS